MKRPTMLVQALLRNAALDLDLSVERDVRTIAHRCEHEGLSFLTISLPTLSDSLERGLEAGCFTCPTSFSRHGSLPRLLGGFFKRVFASDGRLLDEPCPYSIDWIRQICRFFKKLNIECSGSRNRLATQHFIDVEGDLRRMTSQVERKDNTLDKVSQVLWSQVFPEIDHCGLVCHHGPGVTADRLRPNGRNRIRKWNQRSEYSYPSDLHCYPNYGLAAAASGIGEESECINGLDYLNLKAEMPVRIVFVPKTQTAPRVIAIEPSHMQYMQQSLKDYVYTVLEYHALTKHSIRFSRQDVNQQLAYSSSIDKRLATLDLKDASDRVHLHLVQRVFKNSGLLEYLEDARSLHATLPDDRNIVLTKYASMGSALCFPVEAMVFYTLVQSAMHIFDGVFPTSSSIKKFSKLIDIYGDDIIVPVNYTDAVVNYLESFALKVNINKSFRFSHFRESCGGDFFKGVAVNPVYAREVPHDDSRQWTAEHLMSWNATADLFYLKGRWHVAQVIRDMLRQVVRRPIPRTRNLGAGLVHLSFLFSTNLRFDRDLQGWKQRRLHFIPLKQKDKIDGDELTCLNKWGLYVARPEFDRSGHFSDVATVVRTFNELQSRHHFSSSEIDDSGVQQKDSDAYGSLSTISGTGHRVCFEGHGSTSTDLRTDFGVLDDDREGALDQGAPWNGVQITEPVESDPLLYLSGRSEGLDFLASVKRGGFKSKHRWTSLAG